MKLSSDFQYNKYNLSVRFVNEKDTDFILQLRTDVKLSRYLHQVNSSAEEQFEWIKKYKEREKEGSDYYFIYFDEDKPIGVNRIYNINATWATSGSWICKPDVDFEKKIYTLIIVREILFDYLGKQEDHFDVRKNNNTVIGIQKKLGSKIVSENEIDYFFNLKKEDFYLNKKKILALLK